MSPRHLDRSSAPGRPPARGAAQRRGGSPVLALQRLAGNAGTTRVLARKGAKNESTFEHSVRIGKLGPVEVKDSNIASWTGKKLDADDLIVTTVKGKHSDELQRMADSRARVETIALQTIVGQNSWMIVTFSNAVIRNYAADTDGKTESWKATRFDHVDIKRTSIGTARP